MASRKPPTQSWESWIDRQIRESQERGEFDELEGTGRPLADLDQPYDALWWVRKKLKEERLAYLPPTLQIRKDLEVAKGEIARARTEHQVRQIIAEINARIRHVNRTAIEGPPSTTMPLDDERTVQRWREQRADGR
jgi:hypothetical protein